MPHGHWMVRWVNPMDKTYESCFLIKVWCCQVLPWEGRRKCCLRGMDVKSNLQDSPEMKQRSCWNRRSWQMRARVDKGGVIVAGLGWRGVLRIEGDSSSSTAAEESCDGWRDSPTVVILVSRRKIASGARPDPHKRETEKKTRTRIANTVPCHS